MTAATLSTHVLDLDAGTPAADLTVELCALTPQTRVLARGVTDADGRISAWAGPAALAAGEYALVFHIADWFAARGAGCFYPRVRVEFTVSGERSHYHVPLLLNRHGYTTYRGS